MTSIFRKPALNILRWLSRGLGDRAAILMYHSVSADSRFFAVKPKDFERQMDYLKEQDFKVVPLSEIVEKVRNKNPLGKEVAITFDDGYRDVHLNAFPILKKYKFPATTFLITGLIGKEDLGSKKSKPLPMMNEADIQEMLGSGLIEFMPHTETHPELPKVAYEEAIREIEQSRRRIELLTGVPADILAFPKGEHTPEVLLHLKRSAWRGAVTTEAGLVAQGDDPFLLRRLPVDSAASFGVFKALLSDAIERYEKLKGKR